MFADFYFGGDFAKIDKYLSISKHWYFSKNPIHLIFFLIFMQVVDKLSTHA